MTTQTSLTEMLELTAIPRLKKDIMEAARLLPKQEIRYLVDSYYQMQENRKVAANQERALDASEEPHEIISWLSNQNKTFEGQIKRVLDAWAHAQREGEWLYSITGVGPIVSAGLMAHVDITKAPHATHIWSFAGYSTRQNWLGKAKAKEFVDRRVAVNMPLEDIIIDAAAATGMGASTIMRFATTDRDGKPTKLTPTSLTNSVARRPWNNELKTLCWKMGEVFTKFSTHPNDIYGKVWMKWKAYETVKNRNGEFVAKAENILKTVNIGKSTDAYLYNSGCLTAEAAEELSLTPIASRSSKLRQLAGKPGSGVPMLTPNHIHSRAKRYAVKMFLSHYHEVAYTMHFGQEPTKPYVFVEHEGSTHVPHDILGYIPPPNWDKATKTVQPSTMKQSPTE